MKIILIILLKIAAAVLAAELVAGAVHWLEDAYVREDTPVLGPLMAQANIVHHHFPRYFTRNSWWESSRDLIALSAALVAGAWFLGILTWPVCLFAAISANANEMHKWTHRTPKENGRIVTFLQKNPHPANPAPSRPAPHGPEKQPLLHRHERLEPVA